MLLCYERTSDISVSACLLSIKCILMEKIFDSYQHMEKNEMSEKAKFDNNKNNNGGSEINFNEQKKNNI